MLSDLGEDLYTHVRTAAVPSMDSLAGIKATDLETESIRRARSATVSSIITAVGNFSVQYNYESISIVLLMMSVVECTSTEEDCKLGHQAPWVTGTSNGVAFAGSIVGQLLMGYLGDSLGRNQAMTITLAISGFSALGSALLPFGDSNTVYIIIIIFRFMLGIGVGGIFPLAATKAAEDAADNSLFERDMEQTRLNMEAAVATGRKPPPSISVQKPNEISAVDSLSSARSYWWQAPGAMAPWFVACMLTYDNNTSTDMKWRLVLGLGALPALAVTALSIVESKMNPETLLTRVSISVHIDQQNSSNGKNEKINSPLRTQYHKQHLAPHSTDQNIRNDNKVEINLWRALGTWKIQKKLLCTGGGWLLYDICYYGVALFGGQIIASLDTSADDDVTTNVNIRLTSIKEMVALSMALPSMMLTIAVLQYYGTKAMQIWGFLFIAICFFLLAFTTAPLHNNPTALFIIYCILLFALAGGTGVTVFVLPAETFPKSIRSTCNGISAACGKVGAITGAYMYGPMADVTSFPFVFAFCGVIAVTGAYLTHILLDVEHDSVEDGLGMDIYGDRREFSIDAAHDANDRDALLGNDSDGTPYVEKCNLSIRDRT